MDAVKQLDGRITACFNHYDSQLDFEEYPFIPTEEHFAQMIADMASAQEEMRAEQKQCKGRPTSVVLAIFQEIAQNFQDRITDDKAFPHRFVVQLTRRINSLLYLDNRSEEDRFHVLKSLIGTTPSILKGVVELNERLLPSKQSLSLVALEEFFELTEGSIAQFSTIFPKVKKTEREVFLKRFNDVSCLAKEMIAAIRSAPIVASNRVYRGLDYEQTLGRIYGIELHRLLDWHEDEVIKSKDEFYQLGRDMDISRDPYTILDQDQKACSSPEEMFKALERYLEEARTISLAYISLPEKERCSVWRIPEFLKDSYPWGGYYYGGAMIKKDLIGAVFLNHYNYASITKGWIQMNAIHECYPGHHAQFVKTAAGNMPNCFKTATLTSKAAPLSEGMAHRSERLMQYIFDYPLFPLFVAYRRLHTAVRIKADLLLHHFGEGEERAIQLYENELQFPRHVAKGQVYSQLLTPGYFTVYYYGMKKLEEMEKILPLGEKEFTELIFSCGRISLSSLKRLLELNPKEYKSILRDFY